jgi:hypothetical protein
MAGYKAPDDQFINATAKNDQITKQRDAYTSRPQNSEKTLGIGADTSKTFTGFNADNVIAASFNTMKSLDKETNSSPDSYGNPDFTGTVSMKNEDSLTMYDKVSEAEDKPGIKGPNLAPPDLDKLIEGAVEAGSSETIGEEHVKNRGFGWRDDRNNPGTERSTIGKYFSKHYTYSENDRSSYSVFGESKNSEDNSDVINYDQP